MRRVIAPALTIAGLIVLTAQEPVHSDDTSRFWSHQCGIDVVEDLTPEQRECVERHTSSLLGAESDLFMLEQLDLRPSIDPPQYRRCATPASSEKRPPSTGLKMRMTTTRLTPIWPRDENGIPLPTPEDGLSVRVIFALDREGNTYNPVATALLDDGNVFHHAAAFEQAAQEAVQGWRYGPGEACENIVTILEFRWDDD
jgi:hypothetical protein